MNRHGRMQKISGIRILIATFWACSSSPLATLCPNFSRLHSQHLGDGVTEGVGLHHRRDEALGLGHVRTVAECAHRGTTTEIAACRRDRPVLFHSQRTHPPALLN